MPRTLSEIFQDHPGIETLKVVSRDDGGPWRVSVDGKELEILDADLARWLVSLPDVETDEGHILEGGLRVRGKYEGLLDCNIATVKRLPR